MGMRSSGSNPLAAPRYTIKNPIASIMIFCQLGTIVPANGSKDSASREAVFSAFSMAISSSVGV